MTRRAAAAALGSGAAGLALPGGAAAQAVRSRRGRPPVVLVHGAWHGGWCWRDVAARLRAAGHAVFAPTLTGLGERAHLRVPVPGLSTHVDDVCGLIEAEELSGLVLVGHSYGGMVVTGLADRMKPRIAGMVYLDAALPGDGQSMITQSPGITPQAAAGVEAGLRALAPDGIWMAPLPPQVFGIPDTLPEAQAWVARRLTPHPLPSWTEPLRLTAGGSDGLARTYVHCVAPVLAQASFAAHAARIEAGQAGPGWTLHRLEAGHDAMVTHPGAVADLIAAAARRT